MPRFDQAVSGQRWRLATLDDRADNVWCQGERGDVGDDVAENSLVPFVRIEHGDPLDGDPADLLRLCHHAATGSRARSVIPKRKLTKIVEGRTARSGP
jgi:hypothetical protein